MPKKKTEKKPSDNYEIRDTTKSSSDHFYHPDINWGVFDKRTGREVLFFSGDRSSSETVQSVSFSDDGTEVYGTNGRGKIIEKYTLPYESWEKFIKIAAAGNADRVKKELKKGTDANAMDIYSITVLMMAAAKGKTEIVKLLLENGAQVNAIDNNHRETALMWAANKNKIPAMKVLLESGADVKITDKDHETVFTRSAISKRPNLIQLLLDHGAKVNKRRVAVPTALNHAAYYGNTAIVRLLLENGSQVNARRAKRGETPLHWAAYNGHTSTVQLLLEHGANPKMQNHYYRTPLIEAIRRQKKEAAKVIFEHQTKIDRKTIKSLKLSDNERKVIAKNKANKVIKELKIPKQTKF